MNVSAQQSGSQSLLRQRPVSDAADDWPVHMHPALQRVYSARGVRGAAEVDHRLARLAAPESMGGLDAACALLAAAIAEDQSILIAGDYDCDGATGAAVAVRGLRMLGARRVDFVVPDRTRHGYGLSTALVDSLAHTPQLLVTVDNGIASVDGVEAARARGIEVIITDHHLPGPELPAAAAIVDPNLVGDAFASKALAGVGVMFYVLLGLRAQMRRAGAFAGRNTEPDLASLLDLVALGTVADMVPLDYNNRILVEAGLRRIRGGKASAGIAALIEVSGREASKLVAADFAFAIAPRLNAAGRLEDMRVGVECLLSDDMESARAFAEQLSNINRQRQTVQTSMVAEAVRLTACVTARDAVGVVLFDSGWHPGVIGLVASKLKERLHRPVIACAPAGDGSGALRASARSIAGFHIRDALAEIDACNPGLIDRFGGHAMAAGLSLQQEHLDHFTSAFDTLATKRLGADALNPILWTDGELATGECTLDLAFALRVAGPWGQAFPSPLFENNFECTRCTAIGDGRHWRLQLADPRDGRIFAAVMFQVGERDVPSGPIRAAYEPTVNDWRGRSELQLLLRHIEAC